MFEYDIDAMLAAQRLDEYDLSPILNECYRDRCRQLGDIRDWMTANAHLGLGEAFGELSDDELMAYLEDRYNVSFTEVSSYWMSSSGPIQKQ